jgi:hypothetical protein
MVMREVVYYSIFVNESNSGPVCTGDSAMTRQEKGWRQMVSNFGGVPFDPLFPFFFLQHFAFAKEEHSCSLIVSHDTRRESQDIKRTDNLFDLITEPIIRTLINNFRHIFLSEEAISHLHFIAVPYPVMILSDLWIGFILVSPEQMMN